MTRELILRERFLDSLLEIEAYLGQYIGSKKARKFPNDVIGFISDIIGNNPFAFGKYESRFPKNSNIRKAIFKKDYCIVYEVTDEKIEILNIYHTSRDPDEVIL